MNRFFNILVFGFCIIFLTISCKSRSYTVIENSDGVTLFHEGKAILKIADGEDSIKLNTPDYGLITRFEMHNEKTFIAHEERIKDEVIIYQVDENGSVLK